MITGPNEADDPAMDADEWEDISEDEAQELVDRAAAEFPEDYSGDEWQEEE